MVGAVASVVHFIVALTAVGVVGTSPQWANVIGFAAAFSVSFLGQYRWTFAQSEAPLLRALWRWLVVSLCGFAINSAAYAWLLAHTAWRYDVALAIVLLTVAVLTFLFSRGWAFQVHGSRR